MDIPVIFQLKNKNSNLFSNFQNFFFWNFMIFFYAWSGTAIYVLQSTSGSSSDEVIV